jgi:hypothetical protein
MMGVSVLAKTMDDLLRAWSCHFLALMIGLALLPAIALGSFCRFSLTSPPVGQALQYDLILSDDEVICINGTVPYLTAVFQHTTLLKIRFFTSTADSPQLSPGGRLVIPSEFSGIGFGTPLGHLEIRPLIPGRVAFTTFVYPPSCTFRYVTTVRDGEFGLAETFGLSDLGNQAGSKICIWSPHPKVDFAFFVFEDARDAIRVCVNDSAECQVPFTMTAEVSGVVSLSPAEHIEIDADNPRFSESYNVKIRASRQWRFFDSAEKLDGKFELIRLIKREAQLPAARVLEPPQIEAREGQFILKGTSQNNSIQIISIFVIGFAVIGLILYWAGTRPLSRRHRDDDAETHLLSHPQQQFPQYQIPYGQPFYQQPFPYQGVTFPFAGVPQ